MTKYMEEEANIIEQQMAVQHRLDNAQATTTDTDYYGQDSDNGSDESFIEES